MKNILESPIRGILGSQKYESAIHWRNGVLVSDEPEKLGGRDLGPDPYTLLLSALVACTLATLRMYIERKGVSISAIVVEANMFHKFENGEAVSYIERRINFEEQLDPELIRKLIWIAESCPISKTLKGNIHISTGLMN
ncbi:MAG TPA: OsmC family protein [Mariniphaga sp.]|jgi:putative redox protein|nr:OsmC family protein [Mariniphaga sp.]